MTGIGQYGDNDFQLDHKQSVPDYASCSSSAAVVPSELVRNWSASSLVMTSIVESLALWETP